jgi:murein DD-endopeptidase MepM/ murein hydrolase activator NlpD
VRTVEADSSGNRFIVIKHDGIPNENGGTKTLYSGYLHLSEISVREGMRVKK